MPIEVVGLKGKYVDVLRSKPKKKKNKESPVEEAPKKRQLLSSAMSAAKKAKVHLTHHLL